MDLQRNNTVSVYVATFDENARIQPVLPAIRNQAIQRCTDVLTKQQRYWVWKLLDYALKQRFGKGVDGFDFSVGANGKWSCDGVYFSLSHSDNVVVAAVGVEDMGVDIEAVSGFSGRATDEAFLNRVLNETEKQQLTVCELSCREQQLALLWTSKESLFKRDGGMAFVPKRIDTTRRVADSRLLLIDGKQYALSVATSGTSDIDVQVISDTAIFS